MRRFTTPVVPAFLMACIVAGCSDAPGESEWKSEVAATEGKKLGGCVVADFDPGRPGDEIAVTSSTGEVFVLARVGGKWVRESVHVFPGEMIQCAAGDVDPDHPGMELVVVGAKEGSEDDGGAGQAWYAYRTAGGWKHEALHETSKLIHAVCIGELDPARPGDEVLVAGYDKKAFVFARRKGGGFDALGEAELPGEAKGAAVAGPGAVVVCANGTVTRITRKGEGWATQLLLEASSPHARVAARGGAVLFCSNDGGLRLMHGDHAHTIYKATDRLRGAVLLSEDAFVNGALAATAGYDGAVSVLVRGKKGWERSVVARDGDRFHHLAHGRVEGLGEALVGCGYSGKVIVAWRP